MEEIIKGDVRDRAIRRKLYEHDKGGASQIQVSLDDSLGEWEGELSGNKFRCGRKAFEDISQFHRKWTSAENN